MSEYLNQKDLKIITSQIGREAREVVKISKRCRFGYPSVIITKPILDNSVFFPTIYWLSCPGLKKETDRLEANGLIAIYQSRLEKDKNFKEELQKSHLAYQLERKKLATQLGINTKFESEEIGIGGIKSAKGIKCLHAHLAQYLATNQNPIGQQIKSLIKEEKVFAQCQKCKSSCD